VFRHLSHCVISVLLVFCSLYLKSNQIIVLIIIMWQTWLVVFPLGSSFFVLEH